MKKTVLAAAIAAALVSQAQLVSKVPDADVAKIERIISQNFGRDAVPSPAKARKVLVFFRCEGFCHNNAISYALKALEIASRKTGAFDFDATTDYRFMNARNFAKYDAVVLLNCTGPDTEKHRNLENDLVNYVNGGKGLCVIHAGCDGFYKAPKASSMIGGRFWGHPWYFRPGKEWSFVNEEPGHPLNRGFKASGSPFKLVEEVYQHSTPPYEPGSVRVLLSLDLKDPETKKRLDETAPGQKRTDGQFPVSWVKDYGKGRVFYTTFGHESNTFVDPQRLTHILDALRWTIGDLAAPSAVVRK